MNVRPMRRREVPNHPVIWIEDDEGRLRPRLRATPEVPVAWAPQQGSQEMFLQCEITEALYTGARGPGKTDALLMDFAQFTGRGFGADWRGILFRRTFPELADIISKSQRWFTEIFPEAVYNKSSHTWRWPTGEVLIFAFMAEPSDYYKYHGHAYPWIGWEELTTWPTDECYRSMFSCMRSANPSVPRRIRANTNPAGVGHNWVKARFELPVPPKCIRGPVIRTPKEPDRVAFHGTLEENLVLLHADPEYVTRLTASADSEAKRIAWLEGGWDIVAGGMIDDVWSPVVHILPSIPIDAIPASWFINRSYDDGQTKPFSVGWWAQSNGEPIVINGRKVGEIPGDLIRINEWYGWNGQPNHGLSMASSAIARGIKDHEAAFRYTGRVRHGVADSSIWNLSPLDQRTSVASEMEDEGVSWEPADKGPGSRVQGWKLLRDLLRNAVPDVNGRREKPGFFVTTDCKQFIRTIPVLPRSESNPEDVDTEAEDHVADETRYRCRMPRVLVGRTTHLIF